MTVHYCHNCLHHSALPDGVYCAWCLDFFYSNRRLPLVTDRVPRHSTATDPRPAIDQLWANIDAM